MKTPDSFTHFFNLIYQQTRLISITLEKLASLPGIQLSQGPKERDKRDCKEMIRRNDFEVEDFFDKKSHSTWDETDDI